MAFFHTDPPKVRLDCAQRTRVNVQRVRDSCVLVDDIKLVEMNLMPRRCVIQKMNYFVWLRFPSTTTNSFSVCFYYFHFVCVRFVFVFTFLCVASANVVVWQLLPSILSVVLRVNCKLNRIYFHILRIAEERSNGAPATNVFFTALFFDRISKFRMENGNLCHSK